MELPDQPHKAEKGSHGTDGSTAGNVKALFLCFSGIFGSVKIEMSISSGNHPGKDRMPGRFDPGQTKVFPLNMISLIYRTKCDKIDNTGKI